MASAKPLPPPQAMPSKRDDGLIRATVLTALVAAGFCLLVALAMVVNELRSAAADPLKSPQLKALREKLAAAPKDEQLKDQIRELDLQLRHQHFRQLSLKGTGAWMLVAGVVVFLIAAKQTSAWRRQPPMPQPQPDAAERAARTLSWSRRSVGVLAALIAVGFLSVALGVGTLLPTGREGLEKLAAGELPGEAGGDDRDLPSPAEVLANWPRFRGPGGNGLSMHTNLPITWDVASGTGIVWKTPVAAPGFGSPVVWGERVFLSGGDETNRMVYCFDAKTGARLWEREVKDVPGSPAKQPRVPEDTTFAAATVATDGRRVFAFFANGDLAAYHFDGNLAWAKNLGVPKNPYGHATSPTTWQGHLIMQLDQGEAKAGLSRLYSFDGATGRVVWQQARQVESSWATPIVIEVGGKPQIITLAHPWVIAYAAEDGTEIWRAECLYGEVTPSPVFAGGTLFVVSPSEKLIAIRPDGQGNVTESHILWTAEDGVPDISSPVSNGELVFVLNSYGTLTCYDAKDGKKIWEHEFEKEFHASPSIAGNRLYLFSTENLVIVVEAGRQFNELGRAEMGELVAAIPAFAPGRIFVRGKEHLFCIGTQGDRLAREP